MRWCRDVGDVDDVDDNVGDDVGDDVGDEARHISIVFESLRHSCVPREGSSER